MREEEGRWEGEEDRGKEGEVRGLDFTLKAASGWHNAV